MKTLLITKKNKNNNNNNNNKESKNNSESKNYNNKNKEERQLNIAYISVIQNITRIIITINQSLNNAKKSNTPDNATNPKSSLYRRYKS